MLRQAREQFNKQNLDEADRLCNLAASAAPLGYWPLVGEQPNIDGFVSQGVAPSGREVRQRRRRTIDGGEAVKAERDPADTYQNQRHEQGEL